MSETISRDAAINELERAKVRVSNSVERAIGRGIIEILDDVEKSIIGLPSAQFATDTNVGTKLGTNLAQLGTDCISRQAAIDALKGLEFCHYMEFGEYIGEDTREVRLIRAEKARDALLKLPSAQPEQRWIPCSERLPKKYGNYLITTGEGEVDLGSYDPDRPGSWSACDAKGFHWVWDVTAWMPLPEPYKRGEQDG